MNEWLWAVVGLALFLGGCLSPSTVTTQVADSVARELHAAHGQMAEVYVKEQRAAARAVDGDRSDKRVKDQQHAAVLAVRRRWAPRWQQYARARAVWMTLDAAADALERAEEVARDIRAVQAEMKGLK